MFHWIAGNLILGAAIALTASVGLIVAQGNASVGDAIASAVLVFVALFGLLAMVTLVLLVLLLRLPRDWSLARRRVTAITGALIMGIPFYLLDIQGGSLPLLPLAIFGALGLLMIVPIPGPDGSDPARRCAGGDGDRQTVRTRHNPVRLGGSRDPGLGDRTRGL